MVNNNFKLVLGSGSPRRRELLTGLDLTFEVRVPNVDEVFPDNLPLNEVATYLANLKFTALKQNLKPNEIGLTADTVVIVDGQILGKPTNTKEAKEMLELLSGKMHLVITGVCIGSAEKNQSFSDSTKVYFNKLTSAEIEYYLSKYKPFDKAGSYGIQEWIGYVGIDKIDGCFYNVMGLPVKLVYKALQVF